MAGTAVLSGHVFKIEQTMMEVTSITKPDTNWRFTDSHGHEHKWTDGKVMTIKIVMTGEYWCPDCEDMHDEWEYRCMECGDEVEPGMISNSENQYVPGLKYAYVDGQSVTLDEFKALWVEYGGDPKHIEGLK